MFWWTSGQLLMEHFGEKVVENIRRKIVGEKYLVENIQWKLVGGKYLGEWKGTISLGGSS